MAVYVDTMRRQYGRMIMCHMAADTHKELMFMAERIGVDKKWLQYAGTHKEHFDICWSKKALAIAAGAILIHQRDMVGLMCAKKQPLDKPVDCANLKPLQVLP